ncbi:MFS transporter [Novosphingobium sp. JCM 18896]|uniref:MFS transporter n=1 Tax=Novosphingobium sp. JCM 18896 TaxID=2989731 RepID=UPI002222C2F5|nr:MFS transporter [Novosphingobium sp. JCM 18896]MCW1430162.1 MFS transporter [Novosphingobium sp. JCM 18896]
MSYLGELRRNVRPLVAASLGVGTSLPLFAYTNSIFAPHLIKAFGWSRAEFALIGLTMLIMLPFLPIIGRWTDRFGVRRVALIGSLLIMPGFIGYSLMGGNLYVYFALFTFVLIIGSMTGTLVYTRVVAESFTQARGLALTIVNCAPAAFAAPLLPLLNMLIEDIGWRMSYVLLGALCCICGLIAVALVPKTSGQIVDPNASSETVASPVEATTRDDYRIILAAPLFWLILIATFLCLLQTQLHSSQMNLMLIDQGLTTQTAANVASIYVLGTLIGRVACGLALDRFSTPLVTFFSMIIPAVGFAILGTSFDAFTVIAVAMFLVGLSVGAETDIMPFIVARYFKMRIYNTTLGLHMIAAFLASAAGALGVSYTLARYDSFEPFLFVIAGSIVVGSTLFLLMPKARDYPKIG